MLKLLILDSWRFLIYALFWWSLYSCCGGMVMCLICIFVPWLRVVWTDWWS